MPNEYDRLIGSDAPSTEYDAQLQVDGDAAKQRLRASMVPALKQNPDEYGQAKQLERQTGIPAPVGARNLPEVQQKAKLNEYDALLGTKTGEALENPDFAKLAHDDTDNLSSVEAALKGDKNRVLTNSEFSQLVQEVKRRNPVLDWDQARTAAANTIGGMDKVVSDDTPLIGVSKGPPPTFGTIMGGLWQSLLSGAEEARQGTRYQFADAIGSGGMQADALKEFQRAKFQSDTTTPEFDSSTGKLLYGGGANVIQNIPILAAAIATRNPTLAAGLAAVQQETQSYPKYRERGGTPGEAALGSGIEGAIEFATEEIPLSFLTEKFGHVPLWQLFAGDQMREQITEQIATHGQDLTDTLIANPNTTLADYLASRPDAALQTAVAVLMQGVVLGGAHAAATKMAGKTDASMRAEQDQQRLQQLSELAKASKVRERDPQSFAAFVDATAADGPVQDVYVNAQTLMQAAGEALPDIVRAAPSVAAQIDEALKTGGDIRIPIGEYAAHIATTDANAALLPHLRTSVEGMSMEEAKTFMQGQADEFKAEAEKILGEKQTDAAFKESAASVERELMTQLKTANRFTDDVNGAYAKLMASFYTVQSARLGITPEEMYVKYPLNITAQAPTEGGGLDQGRYDAEFPRAGAQVDGRTVRERVPNQNSIRASLTDYTVLPGVRDVPLSAFDPSYVRSVKPESLDERTRQLTDDIKKSGEINPLIVVKDGKGLYVLEGAHRFDALIASGAKSLPALVVLDNEGLAQQQALPRESGGVLEQNQATTAFEAWSDGDPVIAADEFRQYRGGAAVFQVYHGTTGDFTEFERERASAESDLGGGFYFTNTPEDVSANYAGEGPDLTNKLERLAEDIQQSSEFVDPLVEKRGDLFTVFAEGEDHGEYDTLEAAQEARRDYKAKYALTMEQAKDEARQQLSVEHGGAVMPVFVHLKNPVLIGGPNETRLTYEQPYDEKTDEYGEETGTLLDVAQALRDIQADGEFHDLDVDRVMGSIFDEHEHWDGDSIGAADLIRNMKLSEGMQYATNSNGDLASSEIVREAFERAGFDGFVDYSVNQKFGSERGKGNAMEGMDENTVHVVAFEPTQIKSAIGNDGTFDADDPNILSQATKNQPGARGSISFGGDIKQGATISLLQNADLSTFLHESGHFYLEVLTDIATQPDAPAEVAADMTKLLDWFRPGMTLPEWQAMSIDQKRDYHEQFARGFEAYLFEGRAPSQELSGLFSRFRAWLLNVYRHLTALKVELSPEVRGVMDRMLATNEQILAAEQARNYAPLFKSAEEAGLTTDEWKAYQELGQQATQDGVDMLQRRSLRDMQWLTNARGRELKRLQKLAETRRRGVEREVTAEVQQEPVYAAQRWLKFGMLPDGTQTVGAKLDLGALKEMYGEEPAAPWRYLSVGKNGLAGNDGLHPDQAAEMFGFTSGDHLVRAILAAMPEAQEIEGKTDQRMLERYGDLSSPEAISKAADEAIHNEARAKFVATELRSLAKATGQKNILAKAAREFAASIISRKKVKDVRPAQYAAAEARAAKAAEKAVIGGNLVEAATEKRNQLVNNYATRAAYDAIDELEKGLRYLKKVGESKTIDPEYREQIDAMLERFELRQVTQKDLARRQSLLEWVESQKEKGLEPVIDPDLLNEARRQNYREMTVEEFRGLVDAVKNIEHLGRLKHTLLTAKDAREFAVRVDEAATSIIDNAKKTVPVKLESNTWADKFKSGTTEFFAMHRKLASMLREMDGFKDAGVLWELLGRPMNYAGDREAVLRETATMKLSELFKPLSKLKEKMFIPAINASLSREGRIMVALNTGNEGNLQRLMDGDRWAPAQVRAVLDTLTKEEMDFVQNVWDVVGGYRTDIGAQQKRLTGVEPEWVEATPVETKHGTYRGGYIPAKYDTNRSTRSLSDEAAAGVMDMWRAKRGFAKTRDSFTKGRADKVVDRPLRKDFGVITQHITEVTHRLAWQEFLVDASRLLRAAPIDNAIREHYGPEALKAMRDAVEDIAAGEVGSQNAFERSVNYVRMGATIAGLGWRLTTSLLQPLGLTQSMVRIGPKYVAKGLVEWIGDAAKMENTAKRIYEKSDMMRLRGKTLQREISEIQNTVGGKNSAIQASYFYLIQKLQLVADIPTWLGQYTKAVEQGADDASAIAQADQAVLDAQGGGQIKDLAAIQRGGPMLKLFTNFYSFFNTTYNLTSESFGRTDFKNPLSIGRLAVDMLLLYSVPAALSTLLKAALHGDDEDKVIKQLIADQLTYLFGTMVGLREFAGAVQTTLGLPGDYQGPASVRLAADVAKLGKQVGQGDVDEALLKAANNVGGVLFHYPAGQVDATADGLYKLATGKTENPGALIVGAK